ncbi:hypothetical protein Tsubulata_017266 [Turnera subulata]|uniref:Peptidase A1 domain-containing protein n=1 Tax=Turnera subulata TaxID=218843 RepID=A0A9Q0JN25_9ROSI|nr:hypothetical protein Tsubulata_017266 [Turnera subulata]
MARATPTHHHLASLFLLLLLLLSPYLPQSLPTSVSPNSTAKLLPSSAMVLPLFLSSPNPSSISSNHRRLLQRSNADNARMRLHDDLLINGYYTTRLYIGTPPQTFALIVDTGSSVTYVPCSTCEQCGKHQDPKFRPEFSSSYEPVKCNMNCDCDADKRQCVYERQYAEMSTSSGVLSEDVISFGNLSDLPPQRAVFGCETVETGDLYSQHADGIMGLGRGDLSIVDQLVDKGAINDSFSLCYGGMEAGGGAMVLGPLAAPSDMVFAHSDPGRSPYYNVDLKEIHVAGKPLPINSRVFDGKYGTVLDSGTTYAYLPEAAFVAFKDAIMKELHSLQLIHGPDPNYNDICFSGAGSNISLLPDAFPAVHIVFGNGQKLLLSPENYLFRHLKVRGAYCLGIFQNGRDPTTLLGGIAVRNTLVMYDRGNSKIGFWKTNCSELWERLHVSSAPQPGPSSSDRNSSTSEISPTMSPGVQPQYVLPEGHQIGQISFEMLLMVNYSDLKLQAGELTESVAQQLSIYASQVRLLNITAKGNGSLIGWAIVPSGTASYISNTTALNIISRVAEHRLQLPDSIGSYELIRWNIKSSENRTWWQQHYLLVVLSIVVIFIVGLSATGIWFILKRKQENSIAYKPVNAPAGEQELQPLQIS